MNKFFLTTLLTGICGLSIAADPQPQQPAQPPQPHSHPQGARRPGPPHDMNQMMVKRVTDTMAKLSQAEDGKLSAERRAVLDKELDLKELSQQQKAINDKMRDARMYAVFKILDTNGDGVLDETEKEKAAENFQKYLKENPGNNPMRGMGMMGPGGRPPRGGMGPGGMGRGGRPPRGGKDGMGKGGRPPREGAEGNLPPKPAENKQD